MKMVHDRHLIFDPNDVYQQNFHHLNDDDEALNKLATENIFDPKNRQWKMWITAAELSNMYKVPGYSVHNK